MPICTALWGSALFLLIHALSSPKEWRVVVVLMTLTQGTNAAINNGLFATHVELSPNFSGTLMGITNSMAGLASIMGPLAVGWIVREPVRTCASNVTYMHRVTKVHAFVLGRLIGGT